MSIKKKLGMGVASAALGIALVGGGTFAYFSDTETSANTFAAGTLDLTLNPQEIINVSKIKPGDSMLRTFKLKNDGSLDIKTVGLETSYEVTDTKGDNAGEDFGEHIRVNFLTNVNQLSTPIHTTTLAALKNENPDVIKQLFIDKLFGNGGLKPGQTHNLAVQFEFVDNDHDQNKFQGDELELTWDFTAYQMDGSPLK
ncbi:cell division protein FtsN [Siminovitchia acidinfaciens]|uniref:Cell division protein FtsN n=1 Tax=Siminovitchia acidinfaciens TaxID=2321395 RepID=A0A429XYC3_9BACI|nr:CalY family protein [Siminovitchia acidinfaciens]RST73734.1 cell division protein FtsN [Siminovitchia acidinfaciens]